ncbi:MAG: GTPase, partial [Acidobacteriota bacterium]
MSVKRMPLLRMADPLDDTIIAISTPVGYGGLGIVRLSGLKALSVGRRIFRPGKRTAWKKAARSLVFGEVFDTSAQNALDEAFMVFFPKPQSYTREDVVEISCHGSPVILEEVVRLGIQAGARLAHPGEFTLRAYLRGRLDMLQAEAVNDLINATSLEQARISFGQLRGRLSREVSSWRQRVVDLISQVEASIEFPEEGLAITSEEIAASLEAVIAEVKGLIASFERGRAMTEGLSLAIVGRANVGKSTLFNALLDEDRAIVSAFPGTTRDYLRERLNIDSSIFQLIDMAGFERSSHPVEKE